MTYKNTGVSAAALNFDLNNYLFLYYCNCGYLLEQNLFAPVLRVT